MRFPYIINQNTKIEYTPSPQSLQLLTEIGRILISEDFIWDQHFCPTLVHFCVNAICKNFEKYPFFKDLPCQDRHHLLELLPTDLPLELVVPLINEEIYWERRYLDKYKIPFSRRKSKWNWKYGYVERYMQELIEEAEPQHQDEEQMSDIIELCKPYITSLKITQLKVWQPPLNWEKEDIPEVWPLDHINFQYVISKLENLQVLDVVFGMNNITEQKFSWNMFKLSVDDARNLGKSIQPLKHLHTLRIHRTRLEDFHTQALMQCLLENETLIELDLSHDHIEDLGAKCIAKLMTVHPKLEVIKLANNFIMQEGAEAIGFALQQETCCPINFLDLRLNPLKFDGTMGILRSLVRGEKPKELSLACCEIEDLTAVRVGQMLCLNNTLEYLDLSSNWLGEEGGEALLRCLMNNRSIKNMDLRETYIPKETMIMIQKLLVRNQLGLDFVELFVEEDEETFVEEEELEEEPTVEESNAGDDED